MGTATVSEFPGVTGAREAGKALLNSVPRLLRGSERFKYLLIPLGTAGTIIYTLFLPSVDNPQSLSNRIQQSTPTITTVNAETEYIPASVRFEQNYLTPKLIPKTISGEVYEQFLQLQKEQDAIDRTLSKHKLVESAVADPRSGIPKDKQSLAIEWMMRTILIESKGRANASSGTANGLAQLTPDTVKWEVQNIKLLDYDPNNEYHNVLIGTTYWWRQFNKYGLELAPVAYNFGPENIKTALQVYSKKTKSPITSITAKELLNDPDVFKKLMENKVPKKAIEEAKLYDTRFKAAGLLTLPQTKG